ncbi:MAG: bifunctional helix-turn-helix transcriptional regulator/GNAT family N-acetyltransferase [Gemmatimonadota bacterium]
MTQDAAPGTAAAERVAAIRRFNRIYTPLVGALDEGHLESEFSLAEVRVMYELAHRDALTAAVLVRELRLDPGYLSRLLRHLSRRKLVSRIRSAKDGRQSLLSLTQAGKTAFAQLEARANVRVAALIEPLDAAAQQRLVSSMETIASLLGPPSESKRSAGPFLLRQHQPGDMGWVVETHGLLYWEEYRWDERFEALVARIVADFIDHYDSKLERCWIAERDGTNVGCVFIVRHSEREGVAKLRLLLVHPSMRGQGIGERLVKECTRFARNAGYRTITLWTNDVLSSARKIYQAEGYQLVNEEAHNSFGHDLVGQTWELTL